MRIPMTSDMKIKLIGLRDGMLEQIRRAGMNDETWVYRSPIFLKPEDSPQVINDFEQSILRKLSNRESSVFCHDDIEDLLVCLASLVSMELTIAELERHELDGQEICGIVKYPTLGTTKEEQND